MISFQDALKAQQAPKQKDYSGGVTKTKGFFPSVAPAADRVVKTVKRPVTAGMGWLGTQINRPIAAVENKITGGRGFEKMQEDIGNKYPRLSGLRDPSIRAGNAFAARVLLDPLNFIGAGVISKGAKALKVAEKGVQFANKADKLYQGAQDIKGIGSVIKAGAKVVSPIIRTARKAKDLVGDKLVYGYKQDPKFLHQLEGAKTRMGNNVEKAANVAKPLYFDKAGKVIPKQEQKALGDVFKVLTRQENRALTPIEISLVDKYRSIVEKTLNKFEKLATQQTKLGIPESTFQNLRGKYSGKRLFASKLNEDKVVSPFVKSGGERLDTSVYKQRLNLSPEALARMGEVKQPAYGAASAALTEMNNIEKLKFYRKLARHVNEGPASELVQLPKSEAYGALSGQKIPKRIAEYIKPMAEPTKNTPFTKATAMFKRGKVIYSPKQLARNILASPIQGYLNPSGRADAIRRFPEARRELKNRGKYYKEYKNIGGIGQTMAAQELGKFAPPELAKFGKQPNPLYRIGSFIQNSNEEINKLAVFINERRAGKTVREAAKAADETGFNYQKVTPFVQKLRRGPVPFITYPLKATNLISKTLVKHPERLSRIASLEKSVQNISAKDAPNEKYLPDYQKQAVRLPVKSKTGNPLYLNARYIYPQGNLPISSMGESGKSKTVSGDPIKDAIGKATDAASSVGMGDLPGLNPLITEYGQLASNRDTFTGKDIATIPGPAGTAQTALHIAKTFLPTPFSSLKKFATAAITNSKYSTTPTTGQSILQELGIPVYQYNPDESASFSTYRQKQDVKDAKSSRKKTLRAVAGKIPDKAYKAIENYFLNEIEKIRSQ